MIFFLNGTYNGEIISYKMCAVKVRNAKLRNYLKPVFYFDRIVAKRISLFPEH
jgi:hypothetical protein